jgi:hypothetical protein
MLATIRSSAEAAGRAGALPASAGVEMASVKAPVETGLEMSIKESDGEQLAKNPLHPSDDTHPK